MPDSVLLRINGKELRISTEASVAAAVLQAGEWNFRTSVTGEARAALCGMGICFECRVAIDGVSNLRSCQIAVRDGMDVRTQ